MKSILVKLKRSFISGATIGTKNFVLPAISILVANRPEFLTHWILINGYFGSLLDLQQDRVNGFVEYLQDNRDIFTKEVISTSEFKDGFVITFEAYLKQRNKQKRLYVQSIFLGFANSNNKIDFEMERMYDLLNKLSTSHLYLLKKINHLKQITITSEERNEPESDYDDTIYLQSLGLLYVNKEQEVNVDITTEKVNEEYREKYHEGYNSKADSYLDEKEIFYLSIFGEDFIKYIIEK